MKGWQMTLIVNVVAVVWCGYSGILFSATENLGIYICDTFKKDFATTFVDCEDNDGHQASAREIAECTDKLGMIQILQTA